MGGNPEQEATTTSRLERPKRRSQKLLNHDGYHLPRLHDGSWDLRGRGRLVGSYNDERDIAINVI